MRCIKCHQDLGKINNEWCYENEDGYCLCEECGEKELIYSEDVDQYVPREDYKEFYSDDEISDLDTWKLSFNWWAPEEDEPDWDAIVEERRLGL